MHNSFFSNTYKNVSLITSFEKFGGQKMSIICLNVYLKTLLIMHLCVKMIKTTDYIQDEQLHSFENINMNMNNVYLMISFQHLITKTHKSIK